MQKTNKKDKILFCLSSRLFSLMLLSYLVTFVLVILKFAKLIHFGWLGVLSPYIISTFVFMVSMIIYLLFGSKENPDKNETPKQDNE